MSAQLRPNSLDSPTRCGMRHSARSMARCASHKRVVTKVFVTRLSVGQGATSLLNGFTFRDR